MQGGEIIKFIRGNEAKASYSENSNSMSTVTHKNSASAVKMKPRIGKNM